MYKFSIDMHVKITLKTGLHTDPHTHGHVALRAVFLYTYARSRGTPRCVSIHIRTVTWHSALCVYTHTHGHVALRAVFLLETALLFFPKTSRCELLLETTLLLETALIMEIIRYVKNNIGKTGGGM